MTFFRIEKEPVWRAVYHASRVRVPNRGAVTSGNETTAEITSTVNVLLEAEDSQW